MQHEPTTGSRMDAARERDLVARSRADPAAFGELYDYYLPRIHGFILRRVGERSVAEDVTAMTFERALAVVRRDDFRNDSFGGWLYRVAANAVVDHVRRDQRFVPLGMRASDGWVRGDDDAAAERDDEPGDDAAVSAFTAALDRDELRRALLTIPGPQRRVIVLRFLDGLEPVEIATVLGCSKATAAVRLHRALRALRAAMSQESTDAA